MEQTSRERGPEAERKSASGSIGVPLLVALVALLGTVAQAIVSYMGTTNDREGAVELEWASLEAQLILKATELGDEGRAAARLCFLRQLGLLTTTGEHMALLCADYESEPVATSAGEDAGVPQVTVVPVVPAEPRGRPGTRRVLLETMCVPGTVVAVRRGESTLECQDSFGESVRVWEDNAPQEVLWMIIRDGVECRCERAAAVP